MCIFSHILQIKLCSSQCKAHVFQRCSLLCFKPRSGMFVHLFPEVQPTLWTGRAQLPLQWVPRPFPGGKADRAWSWQTNSHLAPSFAWIDPYLSCLVPGTHTAGSKLRCQTPTTHTKNITSNFSQARSALPDDGSQTIRNMSEWFLIVF